MASHVKVACNDGQTNAAKLCMTSNSASALLAALKHLYATGILQEVDEHRSQPGCAGLFTRKRMHYA